MSIFSTLLGGRREAKTLDITNLTWAALLGSSSTKSGVAVTVSTALQVTTVLACCRVLAEGIAQLPLKLHIETEDGAKQVAKKHPLHKLISRRPNDWQTSFEWREMMMFHAALSHGGYSYISRSSSGKVLELIPLLPSAVIPLQLQDRTLVYQISDQYGIVGRFPKSEIFHIRGPSWNGYAGLEIIQLARDAIGLAIAGEESLARLHSNGTRPSGILSTDQTLDDKGLKRIKTSFQEAYTGVQNAFKTLVLDAGMKFSQMSLSPADTQSTETRKHQIEEICRAFRVFPQMVGYADKTSTYASAEQFFLGHVIHSLGPWIERWEEAISRDLLTEPEIDQGYFAKFAVGGLLRGDAASRTAYYKGGITDGWMTRNEARKLEDFDPLEGLDEPLVPLNMSPANGKPADPTADPAAVTPAALAKAIAAELGAPHLETKIGRVLSARNEGKLKKAQELLGEVLAEVDQKE